MLQYEFAKDEIGIRAESLSYFTLFSILPLLAGAFLLVSFFSQWAPVQTGFQSLIERFLSPIPDDYRDDLMDFVVQFKDDYLQKISQNSSSLGIFALIVLVWIGAKVYFNIENLMNRIWNTDERRPWVERIQNFVVCGVIAPLAGVVVITLPTILKNATEIEVGIWWEQGLPLTMVFLSLTFVFKLFPNTRVRWKSAFGGSIAATLMFGVANLLLQIYFRFGTNTAYGKMAVVPLFAIFIYVFWVIFILGAELSFLMQHPHVFDTHELPKGTFAEAVLMVEIVRYLKERFHLGKPSISLNDLSSHFKVGVESIRVILAFLIAQKIVFEAVHSSQKDVDHYHLARELSENNLLSLIKDYLNVRDLSQSFDVQSVIHALNSK